MNNTTPRYTAGQAVEVLRTDFTTPGMPNVWFPGVVAEVAVISDGRVFDALVHLADGKLTRETFGKRGGGQRIRAAA